MKENDGTSCLLREKQITTKKFRKREFMGIQKKIREFKQKKWEPSENHWNSGIRNSE